MKSYTNLILGTSLLPVSLWVASAIAAPGNTDAAAPADTATVTSPADATDATKQANKAIQDFLPFSNTQDFTDAKQGFIADLPSPIIKGASGNTVIDLSQYDFLRKEGPTPDTVNPSLWRQSQLLAIHGLFKVVDGIYQVRNIDLANITFIRGKTGWIVVDPLTSAETAKAALDLINEKVEKLRFPACSLLTRMLTTLRVFAAS